MHVPTQSTIVEISIQSATVEISAWFKDGLHLELTLPGQVAAPCLFGCGARMDRHVGAAARLPESERKDLAVLALARSATGSDLAARHGVSRKFVCQQTHKAQAALDDAFMVAASEHVEMFALTV